MTEHTPKQEVVVTDVHMRFSSMVVFMIKWAIAAIPAFLMLILICAITWNFATTFFRTISTRDAFNHEKGKEPENFMLSKESQETQDAQKKNSAIESIKLDFKQIADLKKYRIDYIFTVENINEFPVKDIEIECSYFAESGTKIDSRNKTIYKIIPAKEKMVFEGIDMQSGHIKYSSYSCKCTDLEIIQQ